MVTQSRDSIVEELLALKRGVQKNLTGDTLNIGGRLYAVTDIVERIDELLDAVADTRVARAALAGAVRHQRERLAHASTFLRGLRVFVRVKYSHDAPTLTDFALAPKKARTRPTTEQKLVIGAKIRATRKKRRTMSKKQKKAIRGDVKGVVITQTVKGEKGEE